MSEINENRINEVMAGEGKEPALFLEADKIRGLVGGLGNMQDTLNHNGQISESALQDLIANMEKTQLKVMGEYFPLSQVITDKFQNDMRHWDVLTKGFLSANQIHTAIEEMTHLPVEVAQVLVDVVKKWNGIFSLDFDSLEDISPQVVDVLGQVSHALGFKKLPLTPEVSERFLQFKGHGLQFAGATEVSPEVAKNISLMECGLVSLPDLKTLSEESAKYLAEWKGRLFLSAAALGDKTAKILSEHTGELGLQGEIADEHILSPLLDCKGPLHFSFEYLSEKNASCFRSRVGGVSLSNLENVENDEAFSSLAKVKGELHLPLLETLSLKGAEYLVMHEGRLDLSGLETVSDDMALILSKFPDLEHLTLRPRVKEKVERLRYGNEEYERRRNDINTSLYHV